MNVSPNVNLERIEEADLKLQFQLNKCLSERWRRGHLEELAGYISASDMCSLSASPDKCAILQETVNQIRQIKLAEDCPSGDDLQKSEVSSSNPTYLGSDLIAPFLLHALDGFLFVVNTDGKIEFISQNVESFLKYHHESLIDNSIYNIIHVGDHARFSSNLLPMSIGNGFGWCDPSKSSPSHSSAFPCRFLVQPQEETMEEKQTRASTYEHMHVSAVLLPSPEQRPEESHTPQEVQNRLVCVARRMPSGEKNNSARGAEQFLTRLDSRGKITSVDTTNLSAANLKYLNKDLVGCIIQEICHPEDFQKLTQHLKDTLQQGSNTSGIYRLRFSNEKIIFVQTRSKRSNYNPMASEHEVIVASHTIIRDTDHCVESGVVAPQRSNPSPSLAMNGGGSAYPFPSLSPQDFNLNDLDFLPSSSWDPLPNPTPASPSAPSTPFATPFPFSPAQSPAPKETPGATNPGASHLLNSGANTSHLLNNSGSPAPHSLNSSGNSGSHLLNSSGSSGSPAPHSLNTSGTTTSHSLNSGTTVSHLLNSSGNGGTTTSHSLSSSGVPASHLLSSSGNCGSPSPHSMNSGAATSHLLNNSGSPAPHSFSSSGNGGTAVSHPLNSGGASASHGLSSGLSEAQLSGGEAQKLRNLLTHGGEDSSKEKMEGVVENGFNGDHHGNENLILRELLNQEDEEMEGKDNLAEVCGDSSLMQKRAAVNNNNNMLRKLLNNDEDKSFKRNQDQLIQQLLKTEGKVSVDLNSASKSVGGPSRLTNPAMDNATKRKSPDTPMEESMAKRPAPQQNQPHAHLAGQNPMLASMLAQTPRSAPTVPTSVASAIVSQLPQERLPKNLEKKLVHTPYTGAPNAPPGATNAHYSFAPQGRGIMQEVVTADARGHVTLAPQQNSAAFNQVNSFMSRMLSPEPSYGATSLQNTASLLIDGLAEASRDPNNVVSASDPLLSDILDQVWSMEQDMNMATDDLAFFKLLEELPDPQHRPPAPQQPPQDPNEKAAIQSIQKQLMSFQPPPSQPQPQQFQPPAYSNRAMPPNQMQQQIGGQRALPQYGGAGGNFNDLTPPMRRQLLEQHKHKVFLQQQFNQKKLLLQKQQQQQQQQQLQQSPGGSGGPFGDNMSDLLNNAVAPNVTLQRSASMPEPQLSPRYSGQPPPSPSQLSPGQRGGPFSPMAAYPPYPQQPRQGAWAQQQRASQQQQANLQQQNPMLNAQLSQQQFANNQQSRGGFSPQPPPRQMLPSPRHSPYPPDFHPPSSPGLFQQQAPLPQQRMQRAVSIPNRVNSPRGLGFDPLLSPQPSPGSYGSPPVSSYGASGNNYQQMEFPPYEQQPYPPNIMDRSRGNAGGAIRSEYVRQELRAKVGARTQQHQMHQQLVQQQMPPASGSQSASQSISQADFDALGFALDMPNDVQPGSPALYSQSLMNSVGGGNSNDPQPRTGSPRFQLEERPAEQKKSLLQQLLSEPP